MGFEGGPEWNNGGRVWLLTAFQRRVREASTT